MQLLNGITITGGVVITYPADPYWANVSFLSETTSTSTQTNNTFLDGSTNNFTITRQGSTTQGSFTPFTVANGASYSTTTNGGSSFYNGTNAYLTAPANAAFTFGTGDFTIELWMYLTTVGTNQVIFDMRPAAGTAGLYPVLYMNSSTITWYINNVARITGTVSTANVWTHVVVARSSGVTKMFLNGVQAGSNYVDTNNYISDSPTIGAGYNGSGNLRGYLSSYRIVKGTALYTTAFTPPTSPLTAISGTSLLLNFTNLGIYDAAADNNLTGFGAVQASTTQAIWAPTSANFFASGYLTMPANTGFTFGTGNFTIETWVYLTIMSATDKTVFDTRPNATNGVYPVLAINNNTIIWFIASANRITGTGLTANAWNHIAVARSSGVTKMFLNGVQSGSNYVDTNNYLSSAPAIGSSSLSLGTVLFYGYLQDLRITKGVARYTTTFTPPTAAFPTNG